MVVGAHRVGRSGEIRSQLDDGPICVHAFRYSNTVHLGKSPVLWPMDRLRMFSALGAVIFLNKRWKMKVTGESIPPLEPGVEENSAGG